MAAGREAVVRLRRYMTIVFTQSVADIVNKRQFVVVNDYLSLNWKLIFEFNGSECVIFTMEE